MDVALDPVLQGRGGRALQLHAAGEGETGEWEKEHFQLVWQNQKKQVCSQKATIEIKFFSVHIDNFQRTPSGTRVFKCP